MNNVSLMALEGNSTELLKKYGLDSASINEFKSKIKQASKEESDYLGKSLFELVAKKGFNDDYEKVIELIYNGANIEFKNEKKGDFALLVCARKNYFKTFIVLVKAGVNINQVNNYLTTATMASARHGNKEMLEILINMGADINARCLDGDNAIMSAKRHDQVECFNMLLNAQAYLNNRNLTNQTIIDLPGEVNFDSKFFEEGIATQTASQITEQQPLLLIQEAEQKLNKLK